MRLRDLITPFKELGPEESTILTQILRELIATVRGNPYTHFEDVTVLSPSAPNTDFAVHLSTLGAVPTGYVVIAKDRAADVYTAPLTATTRWTRTMLWLRCTTGSTRLTVRVT
jgi:hypothetical protein